MPPALHHGMPRAQLGLRASQRPARCPIVPKALYHNPGPRGLGGERAHRAQESVSRILELVSEGDRAALCDYLATSNLTGAPTLKLPSQEEVVVFEDVMESMLLRVPNRHFLDSYAIRHLILSSPASTQVLSGLMLGPAKYVQRMAVSSASGEHSVLTFTMTATTPPQDVQQTSCPEPGTAAAAVASASVPADQASAPEGGLAPLSEPEPVWRLQSVLGEPRFSVAALQPAGPSPELSPEQIVEAQLAAMQRKDVPSAFRLLSPGSQRIIGDERQFADNLARHRRYGGLLGHIAATSVRRCMARPSTYMEIVSVTSASGTRFVFCYILSKESQGPGAGCWSIDFVKVVDDPKLVAAVEASCAAQRKGQAEE